MVSARGRLRRLARGPRMAAVAAVALACGGCGEPFMVLGDVPGLMRIVLGVPESRGSTVDSVAVRTRLTDPTALAFDEERGLLYVADRAAVRQVGGITTRVARIFAVTSDGRSRLLLDAGGCREGQCILEPAAMALDPAGALIIADPAGHRVLRYPPYGAVTVVAGTGVRATAPDGARADASPIHRPAGVAVAPDGRIFVSEGGAHRVRVIGTDGRLGTVAGTGEPADSARDGGPAIDAGVRDPAGLAFAHGVLYIAEYGASTVRAVHPDGTIRTIAGLRGEPGFSGDAGAADSAQLDHPTALAVPPTGRALFISDTGNDRVRVVDLVTGSIRTFAGTGDRAYSGNRRAAGETSLSHPAEVDASASGFLFIADPGHSVVWRTSLGLEE